MHQIAGFCICNLQNFPGLIPRDLRRSVPGVWTQTSISAWLPSVPVVFVIRNDRCILGVAISELETNTGVSVIYNGPLVFRGNNVLFYDVLNVSAQQQFVVRCQFCAVTLECCSMTAMDTEYCVQVAKLQRASLRDPVKVEVCNKYQTVDKLLQFYLFIPAREKVVSPLQFSPYFPLVFQLCRPHNNIKPNLCCCSGAGKLTANGTNTTRHIYVHTSATTQSHTVVEHWANQGLSLQLPSISATPGYNSTQDFVCSVTLTGFKTAINQYWFMLVMKLFSNFYQQNYSEFWKISTEIAAELASCYFC